MYHAYLEDLAVCLKHKDPRYGAMLIRAILGCRKAVTKISLLFPAEKIRKAEVTKKEIATQSCEKDRECMNGEFDGLFSHPADAKLLSDILQRLESLTNNRMTNRLIDIYRSLNKMYTEVPQPSEMPEMYGFQPDRIVEEIQQNLSDFHREMTNFVAKRSITRNKCNVGLQCDVRPDSEKEREVMVGIAKEKELENLRLNNVVKKYLIDIDSLKDLLSKEKLRNNSLEEQINILDFSLRASKSKENKSQETAELSKAKFKEITSKLDLQLRVLKVFKKDLKTAEAQMQKIFNTLVQWDEELFETKVNYRVTEEKLKQIEKAYSEKTGKPMEYVPIVKDEVIKKYNISKRQFEYFPWMTNLKQKQEEREAVEAGHIITHDDDFVHAYFESNRSSVQGYSDSTSSRKASIPGITYQPQRPQLTTSKLENYSKRTVYKEPSTNEYIDEIVDKVQRERFPVEIRGKESDSIEISSSSSLAREKKVGTITRITSRDDEEHKYKYDKTLFNQNETLDSVIEYGNISTFDSRISSGDEYSESKNTVEIRKLNQDEILALLSSGKPLDEEDIKRIQRWVNKSYDKFGTYLPHDLQKMLFTIRKVEDKLNLAKKPLTVHSNSKDTQGYIHRVGAVTEPLNPSGIRSNIRSDIRSDISSDICSDIRSDSRAESELEVITTHKRRSKTLTPGFDLNSPLISSPQINRRSPRSSTVEELDEGEHPSIRKLLNKIMTGHDSRCAGECLHLKRAMALKAKYRGKPYPVNHTRIEYLTPPEIEEL